MLIYLHNHMALETLSIFIIIKYLYFNISEDGFIFILVW